LWAVGVAAALFVALIVIAVIRAGRHEFGSMVFRVARGLIAVVFGWTYISRTGDRDRPTSAARSISARPSWSDARSRRVGDRLPRGDQYRNRGGKLRARRVREPRNGRGGDRLYRGAAVAARRRARIHGAARPELRVADRRLRRTIAADRYGLASQVLATRDGCTADACDAFGSSTTTRSCART
jgi:hypothetical protein